ncbi:MAG: DUF362 domain-containing protein [Rhodopirellula sp.]|nr:DUF362 domain-containing protein [Rhodopirellula sp.]
MFIHFPKVNIPVEGTEGASPPPMVRIRQKYDAQRIDDIPGHLLGELERLPAQSLAGKRIAITVGSRGIPNLDAIVSTLCRYLRQRGAQPFIVPAMGSHGGATAEGQRALLSHYGISEEIMGAPIVSDMAVEQYGEIEGLPLYCDRHALRADAIVVLNKVKPHTDFRGDVESGLCKMIAVGLGKHRGASALHARGFSEFPRLLPRIAEAFISTAPVLFGIGLVQNAYDEICALEAMRPKELIETDRRLLKVARERLARFKFDELDVLVIDEIGKNISGFGFDPNVVGRINSGLPGFSDILKLQRLFIRDITEETEHNGCGISAADVTTRRCLNAIDWEVVWTNMITSTMINGGKIPLYMNSDREALSIAIRTCSGIDHGRLRLARIRNTLQMSEIEVSEALYEQIRHRPDVEYLEGPYAMRFDEEDNLI